MSCSFPKAFYIALSDERPSIDCLSLFRLRVSSSYLVRSDYMSSRSSSLKVLLFAVVVHAALACNSPKIKQHSPTTEIMINTFSLPIIRRYFYFKKKRKKKKKTTLFTSTSDQKNKEKNKRNACEKSTISIKRCL